MKIVNELEIKPEDLTEEFENIDEQIEETIKENTQKISSEIIDITAICSICDKVEHINEETIKLLSEITFKRNPDARGARLQEAFNFAMGNTCTDNESHAFIFNDEWFENTNRLALTIKENNETYSNNLTEKHKIDEQIVELSKKLTKMNEINDEILKELPQLNTEFEKITGTKNYKAWI